MGADAFAASRGALRPKRVPLTRLPGIGASGLLHNETALALQKRLQWAGRTMVTMPIRVRAA